MRLEPRHRRFASLWLTVAVVLPAGAKTPDQAEQSVKQFLAQRDIPHPYRATRRLEAENGGRSGWLEAATEYSPATGFRYAITAEGGSDDIRVKVLRAVLDGERDVIAKGEMSRSSLAPANYIFQTNGVDSSGLANVLLSPKRKEHGLLSGTMFLRPLTGDLVRIQGRLAKSPSFWVRNVDIVRTYERIENAVVPVALETTAQVRFLGPATLRMTYVYSEIDGRPVPSGR